MSEIDDEDDADGEKDVVTAFLRNRGDVLLLWRSDVVGTYPDHWGGVSGYAEGDPDEQVTVEIREETGLESAAVELVRTGRPVHVEDAALERTWRVHPFLFDCETRAIELSEEHTEAEWVPATAIYEADRETVPALWEAYERVAPTVRSITADDDHGAAYLSIRALEVLRDRAGVLLDERADEDPDDADAAEEREELTALARRLLEARPSMAVLRNRVNRAVATAPADRGADGMLTSTIEGIERACTADADAAANAAEHATGTVLTLSRSGTVLEALRTSSTLERVFVAESRPACEGTTVAEDVAETTATSVTVHTDAAVAHIIAREGVDRVLVGADTVLPDGRVINKTGTRGAAIAAAREDVPVFVVAASDKVSTRETVALESGSKRVIYDGDARLDVANPTFDVTPADCVRGIVTEERTRSPDEIEAVAEELRALEAWNQKSA